MRARAARCAATVGRRGAGDLRKALADDQPDPSARARRSQVAVENELREKLRDIPGARFTIGYGGNGEKVQLVLSAEDNEKLQQAAHAVVRDLRSIPGLGNVTSTASLLRRRS